MSVEYKGVENWPSDVRQLVERATGSLQAIIKSEFDKAEVVWVRNSQDRYVLTVAVAHLGDGKATASFERDDLQNDRHVRIVMYQLWSELLREYERRLIEGFAQPVAG